MLKVPTWGGCPATRWLVELPAAFLSPSIGAGVLFVCSMVGCRALLPFSVVGRVEMVLGTSNWVKAMEKKGGIRAGSLEAVWVEY